MSPESPDPPAPRTAGTTPVRRFRRDPAWSNHVDVPAPIPDRRVSGAHWWDADRLAHAQDAPAYCPACGTSLDRPGSIAVEYWESDRRTFHVRCDGCAWSGDVTKVDRMLGHEPPHD